MKSVGMRVCTDSRWCYSDAPLPAESFEEIVIRFRPVFNSSEKSHRGVGVLRFTELHSIQIFSCYPSKYRSEVTEQTTQLTQHFTKNNK